ncbi:lysoplasmalogenase [Pacificoceanicola onchidii]|uniref:lysoplasmalogenase n=1 Tax=Pacificoceanicola onchidii TaxID=2562685 RepID=UPI0010A30639|nr:lysoplasmalogenase [Pacificoceanicola onchidii]
MIPLSHFDLLCVAIFLGGALAYPLLKAQTLTRSMVKTLAILALIPIALNHGAPVVALALLFSAIGDWSLSRPGKRAFLIAMVTFLCAHLVYIALFWQILDTYGAPPWPDRRHRALIILGGFALWTGYHVIRAAGDLRVPVALYCAAIAAMAVLGVQMPQTAAGKLISAGAILFVISDALIGRETFLRKSFPGQPLLIWITYCAAQALLTYGLLALLNDKA